MFSGAYRRARARPATGGFSLVELLIVVAVIAVLSSILLPALGAARNRAKEVVCASRLRQWGLAFEIYAAQNRGIWPHCDGLDRGPPPLGSGTTRADEADWFGWMDVLPPMIRYQPFRDFPRGEKPDYSTFYQCPFGEALRGNGVYSYRPYVDGYYSYAMNSCLELDENAWQPLGFEGPKLPSFLDTAKIVAPARVVLLFDQLLDPRRGYGGDSINRSAGKHSGSYPKAFAARHRHGPDKLGGNILFCDGHVEWWETVWKETWDPELEVPPRDDPNWYPYLPLASRWR